MRITALFIGVMTSWLALVCNPAQALDNRTDKFLAGRYGGVNLKFPPDAKELPLVEEYGFDWFWLQHQGIIPMIRNKEPGVERLKKLVGRTRIIYRGWFLGSRDASGRLLLGLDVECDGRLNGKDWLHLADDPELLKLSLAYLDSQIDLLQETLGKDSIYAVSLGEEEPEVGMQFGRGSTFFATNREENSRKIIKVNNQVYEHLKKRYPNIKVAVSYYPDYMPEWAYQELKYDCIAMDSYPADAGKDLDRHLANWLKVYPPTKEVYLVIWGAGETRPTENYQMEGYSLKSRAEEVTFARKVLERFCQAGYRNIGFFGLYCNAPVLPTILSWIDEESPGTYRSVSVQEFSRLVNERTVDFESSLRKLEHRFSPSVRTEVTKAREMARKARRSGLESTWRSVLHCYHKASLCVLTESDPLVERLRGCLVLKDLADITGLGPETISELPPANQIRSLMAKASVLKTLPDFYQGADPVLALLKDTLTRISSALETKYAKPAGKLKEETTFQIQSLIQKIKSGLAAGQNEETLQAGRELVSLAVREGLVQQTTLTVLLINPYQKQVNAKPAIQVSEDGQNWTTVYDNEPFHTDNWVLRMVFPVPDKVRFVKINNKHWIGWFNLDLVSLDRGNEKKVPKAWQIQGDVRNPENVLTEDGKHCLIVNNSGGEEAVAFEFAPWTAMP